jgi:O-antigen/teichoic acid export membrane protein
MKLNRLLNFGWLKNNIIISNSLWLLAEKILLVSLGLLLSVMFARLLGPEEFGRYNYILSLVALFIPIFSLGIGNILLRELSEQPSNTASLLASCFKARFITAFFVSAGVIVAAFYIYGANWKPQLISMLLFAHIFNAFEVYERWFQHQSDIKRLVYWRSGCFILFAALKLMIIYQYQSYIPLIMIMALEVITKNSGYYVLYKKDTSEKIMPKFNLSIFVDVFSQSKYLIFSSLAAVIYLKIDILMLEYMLGDEAVGTYSVAARLSEVWYILPQIMIITLFPSLISLAKNNNARYLKVLQLSFDYLFMSALILSICIFIVSPWLIDTLYGEVYSQASTILRIHIFASLFIYMRVMLSQWFVSKKLARFSLFSQVSGAVVNVALNLLLIPYYGVLGAAVATVISYAVSAYFCLFCFKQTRDIALMMTKSIFFIFRLNKIK